MEEGNGEQQGGIGPGLALGLGLAVVIAYVCGVFDELLEILAHMFMEPPRRHRW